MGTGSSSIRVSEVVGRQSPVKQATCAAGPCRFVQKPIRRPSGNWAGGGERGVHPTANRPEQALRKGVGLSRRFPVASRPAFHRRGTRRLGQLSSAVEQRFCKPWVVGSIPTAGSIYYQRLTSYRELDGLLRRSNSVTVRA
ncbi:MAG: hypothetical protein RIS76_220 [Verrucomicrobiota bacterium]